MAANFNHTRTTVWIVAARAATQLCALALILAAARLLGPAEVGAFVLISTAVVLINQFADAGWGQYVIAHDKDRPLPATVVWLALVVGLLCAAVGWLGALAVWHAFPDPRYGLIFFILASLTVSVPYQSALIGRLIREERAGEQARVAIAAEFCGVVVGLVSLYAGYGIFALVAGRLIGYIVQLAGLVYLTRWMPRPHWDRRIIPDIRRFVSHMIATRIVGTVGINSPELIIGWFLGPAEVGIYRAASRMVGAVFELAHEATRVLSWMTFRDVRIPLAKRGVGPEATRFIGDLMFFVAPLYLGLAAISTLLVSVLLGPEWQAAAGVIIIIAFARLLLLPFMVNEALFGITQQTELLPRLVAAYTLAMIVGMLLLAGYGIFHAAVAQLFASLAFLPYGIFVQVKRGNVDWRKLLVSNLPKVAAAGALMVLGTHVAGQQAAALVDLPVLTLVVKITVGAALYLALMTLLRPDLVALVRRQLPGFSRLARPT